MQSLTPFHHALQERLIYYVAKDLITPGQANEICLFENIQILNESQFKTVSEYGIIAGAFHKKLRIQFKSYKANRLITGQQYLDLSKIEVDVSELKVDKIQMSVRLHKCLVDVGVRTLEDLTNKKASKVFTKKNYSVTLLEELKTILTQYHVPFIYDLDGPNFLTSINF